MSHDAEGASFDAAPICVDRQAKLAPSEYA